MRLACIGAAVRVLAFSVSTVVSGCLTAQPPDLPEISHRPTILPDEVPSTFEPLVQWPIDGLFIVHVQVDPGSAYAWSAFFDYDPHDPSNPFAISPSDPVQPVGGAPVEVQFTVPAEDMMMDGFCHRIDFVVAAAFSTSARPSVASFFYTPSPTSLGGDVVTWWYTGGLYQASCSPYGGALPDGGYPPPDAAPDSPPLVPE
jgi:hypothetical protein